MLGNIGDLFVKVTNCHLSRLLGVSDYFVMYRHRAQLAKITNWVSDPSFCEKFVARGIGVRGIVPLGTHMFFVVVFLDFIKSSSG